MYNVCSNPPRGVPLYISSPGGVHMLAELARCVIELTASPEAAHTAG